VKTFRSKRQWLLPLRRLCRQCSINGGFPVIVNPLAAAARSALISALVFAKVKALAKNPFDLPLKSEQARAAVLNLLTVSYLTN